MNANQKSQSLVVATAPEVKDEMELHSIPGRDAQVEREAEDWLERLLKLDMEDEEEREAKRNEVEGFGMDLQEEASRNSEMLKQPIRELTKKADDKGDVGGSLMDLKNQVERLDPAGVDFEPGWVGRLIGKIPGVGQPMKRYFTKYESAQNVINDILRSLEKGRDQLARDLITLTDDQKRMRETTGKLARAITTAQVLDEKLNGAMMRSGPTDPKRQFIGEELLFPLRQRLLDLQQQLAVNQQGVIACEIIIRNNKELIRGVNRALNVTATALNVGATVAIALAAQKNVIDKVNAVSDATSAMIASTAARLKTQGTEIHRQAATPRIHLDALRSAFADLNQAMNDLSSFRRAALPEMAKTVIELDRITAEGEKAILRMEGGRRARGKVLSLASK